MNSIPMTAAGLKEQYEHYQRTEEMYRKQAAEARRLLSAASRERKAAYARWQRKVKEDAR